MSKLIVTVKRLNKRTSIPASLADKSNIAGVVNMGFVFIGEEEKSASSAIPGVWYRDRDNFYYWSGGLSIISDEKDPLADVAAPDNSVMEVFQITPQVKRKVEQVINAFETGSAAGNYSVISKHKDYKDPHTGELMVQVTYGRSQTTEFGHLKTLINDYVNEQGKYADQFRPFLSQIGKKPSLATNSAFCLALKNAGKYDPKMKTCQDNLFESKYYLPAYHWFSANGFKLPLSLLVIYDSYIHSGSIMSFLRNRFAANVPAKGGNEREWIQQYVNVRHNWLGSHSNSILHGTVYRTNCFKSQIVNGNWDLTQPITANGLMIT